MTVQEPSQKLGNAPVAPNVAIWLWLSMVVVLLAVTGSIASLSVESIYADLTSVFLPQALAQDIANLVLIAPLWVILVVLALRGSLRAYLLWLGVLTFTVYNYTIYTFSIPFGPLFLLWIAVWGLSLFALIGGISAVDHKTVMKFYTSQRVVKVTAWLLIIISILIGMIWLSEDVPAILSNTTPPSLLEESLPTNPVHILDLGFFLPAVISTGVLLLKSKPLGFTLAPIFIVLLALTGIPILLTPAVQTWHGIPAVWGVIAPIGILTIVLLGLLVWLLSTIKQTY